MRSPIRTIGLLSFLAITGLLVLIITLAINPVVSEAIRTAGSEAVGAKVELESADLSLTEQRLELSQLVVADPRAPMFNLFEINKLAMDVDADALLWNKIVIDELTVTDLYLNTPRTESGEYESRWLDKSAWNPMQRISSFDQMNLDNLPDAEEVVANEELETPAAIEAFRENINITKQALTTKIQTLPDESKLQDFENRFNEIKQQSEGGNKLLGLLSQGKEIKRLQKDIKAELAKVKSVKNDLKQAQDKISADFKALKAMPDKDWQRLKSKYSLSGNGVNEIVSSVFGEQIGGWAQKGWHYYQIVSPYLNSYSPTSENTESQVKVSPHITERGRQVLFEDKNPLPNYLIKKIQLSSQLQDDGIALSGLIENLTTEPDKWLEPMKLDMSGQSGLLDSFNIQGLFDHRDATQSQDSIKLDAAGLKLSTVASANQQSAFTINNGVVDISADIKRLASELDGTLELRFNGLSISSEQQNTWQMQLVEGINSLKQLAVTIHLSGDINNPDISIDSADLTTIGQAIIREMASDKIAAFETELQEAITAKTSGLLADVEGLADISALQDQLNLTELNLDNLLKIK